MAEKHDESSRADKSSETSKALPRYDQPHSKTFVAESLRHVCPILLQSLVLAQQKLDKLENTVFTPDQKTLVEACEKKHVLRMDEIYKKCKQDIFDKQITALSQIKEFDHTYHGLNGISTLIRTLNQEENVDLIKRVDEQITSGEHINHDDVKFLLRQVKKMRSLHKVPDDIGYAATVLGQVQHVKNTLSRIDPPVVLDYLSNPAAHGKSSKTKEHVQEYLTVLQTLGAYQPPETRKRKASSEPRDNDKRHDASGKHNSGDQDLARGMFVPIQGNRISQQLSVTVAPNGGDDPENNQSDDDDEEESDDDEKTGNGDDGSNNNDKPLQPTTPVDNKPPDGVSTRSGRGNRGH